MITSFTEGRHAEEFILSEANGTLSRENGAAGGTLKSGEVVKASGGNLVSYNGSGTVVGIAMRAAVNGDKIAYFARQGEVNGNMLSSTEQTSGAIASGAISGLAALGIVVRT